MRAGNSALALGNQGRQCGLVIGFSEREQEASLGRPPPKCRAELVTWPWPDGPAPGREPRCPEMSSGVWGSILFSLLWVGLGVGGWPRAPFLRDPPSRWDPLPSRCPACWAFLLANENSSPDSSPKLSTDLSHLGCCQPISTGVTNIPILQRKQLRLEGDEMTG